MTERQLLFLMTSEQAKEFTRLLSAAESGDGAAACRLGDMYREGSGGLRYSPKQTFRWYSRAALAGDREGQNNLGACFEHGVGCNQSYSNAVKWYRLSAAQHLGTATMNLGYCYLRGHGVPANRVEAVRLLRLAVQRGEEKAAKELERLGEPVEEPNFSPQVRFTDVTEDGRNTGVVGGLPRPACGIPRPAPLTKAEPHSGQDFEGVTDPAVKAAIKDDCFDLPPEGSLAEQRLRADADELLEMARKARAKKDAAEGPKSERDGSK